MSIKIGELYINSVKFNDNKDNKGKSKVLSLYLAHWKGLRGRVLKVVKVMEVKRQLKNQPLSNRPLILYI